MQGRRWGTALVALSLGLGVLAGCSDDGARGDFIEAVLGSGEDDPALRCTSGAIVDAVDVEELEAAEVTPEELADGRFVEKMELDLAEIAAISAELGDLLVDRDCDLVEAIVMDGLTQLEQDFQGTQEPEIDDDGLGCLDIHSGEMGDAFLKATIDPGYDFEGAIDEIMRDVLFDCPDAFAQGFASLAGAGDGARQCLHAEIVKLRDSENPPASEQLFALAAEACKDQF